MGRGTLQHVQKPWIKKQFSKVQDLQEVHCSLNVDNERKEPNSVEEVPLKYVRGHRSYFIMLSVHNSEEHWSWEMKNCLTLFLKLALVALECGLNREEVEMWRVLRRLLEYTRQEMMVPWSGQVKVELESKTLQWLDGRK